jgi:pyrroline-5-carboxylate reductase
MSTIGFLGAGNMAEALIRGVISAKLYSPRDVLISDVLRERLDFLAGKYGVTPVSGNAPLAGASDILVLAVKPQKMAEALDSIGQSVKKDALVVSIAAGIRTARIASILGDRPIVRVMPNTPALIGEGASAIFANKKAKPALEKALKVFTAVGKAVVVEDEEQIDAVTAVSGSGPAYFFLLMEEMNAAARKLGLSEQTARELVLQTARGAALLAAQSAETPAQLRRKVTSPGGTTEAAIKVFGTRDFSALVTDALTAARDRSRELSG